jgi:hypothetical protein
MPTLITLRSDKGSPLTIPEVDDNFSNLRDAVDGAIAAGGAINYGPTTPAVGDRNKPWFETDISYNPEGWASWNGAAWVPIPAGMPSGSTVNRPVGADGKQYFDTDIHVALVYERAAWRTLSGSPGDCKFVTALTLPLALTANPGWIADTALDNRVLAGASNTHATSTTAGSETHALTSAENGPHTHTLSMRLDPNGGDHNASGTDTYVNTGSGLSTASSGSGTPFSIMQPTLYRFALVKE